MKFFHETLRTVRTNAGACSFCLTGGRDLEEDIIGPKGLSPVDLMLRSSSGKPGGVRKDQES
jgi:hypothetical protein